VIPGNSRTGALCGCWRRSGESENGIERGGAAFVLLIHFPGQTAENDVTSSVPELMEHDIIAGMLQGKIGNPEELQDFVTRNSR
jgi:hypothetical protein